MISNYEYSLLKELEHNINNLKRCKTYNEKLSSLTTKQRDEVERLVSGFYGENLKLLLEQYHKYIKEE